MQNLNPKVNFYFEKSDKWKAEVLLLRSILLSTGLSETLKWGTPCYTHEDRNIVLIHTFKEYCAILFFKGALMKDKNKVLIQQSENTQAARQMRFTATDEIAKLETVIKKYVQEAVAIEKSGAKVSFKNTASYTVPEEFAEILKSNAKLKDSFYKLTPGRQRAYLLYFAQAKQSKTRISRIEKSIPDILKGKGLKED